MGKKWDINERTMKVENRKGRDEMELPCAAAEKLSPMSILVSFGKKMGKEQCKVDIVWCPQIPGYCTPVFLSFVVHFPNLPHIPSTHGHMLWPSAPCHPSLTYLHEGREKDKGGRIWDFRKKERNKTWMS